MVNWLALQTVACTIDNRRRKPMYLSVNLNDPADIRAAIEELQRRVAPVGDVAVADVFVEDVCRRLGMRMQALVGAVLDAEEDRWLTIRDLATILDRPWS